MGKLTKCAACGISGKEVRFEKHHIVPKRAGGAATETIVLCQTCHKLVERPMLKWPPAILARAMCHCLEHWESRLLILKLAAQIADAEANPELFASLGSFATSPKHAQTVERFRGYLAALEAQP